MCYAFSSYILPIINKMNKEFQSENVKIHIAYANICGFYKTILGNYIKRDGLISTPDVFTVSYNNLSNFLAEDQWYFCSKIGNILGNTDVSIHELSDFRVRCLNFYTELASQICKHLKGMNNVLPLLNVCDPAVVKECSVRSLVRLLSKFPQLIDEAEYDQCNDEWRTLPFHSQQ